jgi:hypothetical protein
MLAGGTAGAETRRWRPWAARPPAAVPVVAGATTTGDSGDGGNNDSGGGNGYGGDWRVAAMGYQVHTTSADKYVSAKLPACAFLMRASSRCLPEGTSAPDASRRHWGVTPQLLASWGPFPHTLFLVIIHGVCSQGAKETGQWCHNGGSGSCGAGVGALAPGKSRHCHGSLHQPRRVLREPLSYLNGVEVGVN